jgi:hypothetical protein
LKPFFLTCVTSAGHGPAPLQGDGADGVGAVELYVDSGVGEREDVLVKMLR